ncbi:MAG TPA: 6-bladed beta-propeller, partial [Candidatus Kapabacteria bacterium]|nr:6-bladed beta-propeller [Candidatus Kapabacteria bacterium]
MKKIILIVFLFLYLLSSLSAIEIKLSRKFTLAQDEENFIIRPGSFFVTEDEMIFVIDSRSSNIKIFDTDGKLASVFGRKGLGPNEFITPFYSAYQKPFLALVDFGRRRHFIYKRS